MAAILKSKMVVSGNDIVRFFYFMTICIRQFPCSLCYIELSSLYLKVAKRQENNINFNISLKNNTTTFKFAHGLPVAVFYAMVFAKKIFSNRKYFCSNLQISKKKGVFRSL